jgi:hypothetical protein
MVLRMGVVSNLKSAFGYGPKIDYLSSPFSEGQLASIVYADIFGQASKTISRIDALGIPAMSKARDLVCGTISTFPLKAKDANGLVADQPKWMYRTEGIISPFLRMVFTVDDLMFYGHSLWEVDRDSEGKITEATRVPYEWWTVSPEGRILIHSQNVDEKNVLYIPGPRIGILDKDAVSLGQARDISAAVATRVANPVPMMEIHNNGEADLSKREAKNLVIAYNEARRDPEGGTVYTPAGVTLVPHGANADAGFAVEGRNAVRLDVANLTGVPAALLEGSASTASLTYSTQEGRRNEFVDFGLTVWMEAIAGRLSADDVVPEGQHVVFDQTQFLTTTPSPTGAEKQD